MLPAVTSTSMPMALCSALMWSGSGCVPASETSVQPVGVTSAGCVVLPQSMTNGTRPGPADMVSDQPISSPSGFTRLIDEIGPGSSPQAAMAAVTSSMVSPSEA